MIAFVRHVTRSWGVRARITLPLAVVSVAVSLWGTVWIQRGQSRQLERHLLDRASAIAHAILHVGETCPDATYLQRFVAALASETGVDLIVVAGGEPLTVIASSRVDWVGRPTAELPDREHIHDDLQRAVIHGREQVDLDHTPSHIVDITLPLRMECRRVAPQLRAELPSNSATHGALMLHVDGQRIRRESRAHTVALIATFLGTIAAMSLGMYGLLSRVVLSPVNKLTHVAAAITAGERCLRVANPRPDEIGRLATAFNSMLDDLTAAALTDRLTGLPNRTLLLDRLRGVMARAQRNGSHYAVMFLDFDRFKIVNDSLGHEVGDELLRQIAERLRGQIRSVDSVSRFEVGNTAARLGGDEFVVLLDDLNTPLDAQIVAERLLLAFTEPFQLGPHTAYSTASIGIVLGDPRYERAEELLRDADTAMYEAKRAGRARFVVFGTVMRERVQRRMQLENDLRKAIDGGQLWLAYQPIVSLTTGLMSGVEALLRWQHPTEGAIGPAEFIPIAQESNLIVTLGEWVLREGCRQCVAWHEQMADAAPPIISINLSRKQFASPHLTQTIARVLAETGLPPERLQLEVTEDSFASDVAAAVGAMHAIKSLGVKLAIDDFGAGSSSFASLHQFPVDVLKVDRALLTDIEHSQDAAALVHGLAVMSRNLGMKIVAEGIERVSQVVTVQELGCDDGQGYYFARPMPADEVGTFALRSPAIECHACGAVAFQNRWGERLEVLQT